MTHSELVQGSFVLESFGGVMVRVGDHNEERHPPVHHPVLGRGTRRGRRECRRRAPGSGPGCCRRSRRVHLDAPPSPGAPPDASPWQALGRGLWFRTVSSHGWLEPSLQGRTCGVSGTKVPAPAPQIRRERKPYEAPRNHHAGTGSSACRPGRLAMAITAASPAASAPR